MRSLLAVWLITLLSLTNLSASPSLRPTGSNLLQRQGDCFVGTLRVSTLLAMTKQNAPITFDGYWELVRNTRQSIVQMDAKPQATIRQELNALASRWDQVTAVELSDNSVMQVDSSYLAAQLRNDPPKLKQLANLLDALLGAHAEYPQKVFTLEDVAPLNKILARPEFQWQEQQAPQTPNWLQKFYDWMDRVMNRFFNATVQYGRVPLIATAVLLFIVSLFFISRGLSRSLVREAQLANEGNDSEELSTSKGAFKRAESLSTQGDYRNAIRYLYLSSLLVLDEKRLMRYDRSRTNREYLRSLSSKPELVKPLRDVIDVFDRVWYGFENVDEQTYQSYVKRVDELREKKE